MNSNLDEIGVSVPERRVKGSGVSGSEGYKTSFREARPKLSSYSDSPHATEHPPHTFSISTCIFGHFTEPDHISAGAGVAVPDNGSVH